MKCVAIGDMLLKEVWFKKELKDCGLFSSYQGFSWKEKQSRMEARQTIRELERNGAKAFPIEREMAEAMIDANIIFTHLCPIGEAIIEEAAHLKYIVTARGGVENIAIDTARRKGISIIHCPMHNAHAVAEITIGLIICEVRNITRAHRALNNGIWREEYPNSGQIREIRNSIIGLIGFGVIAQLVAERLQPFGCRIMVYDPYVKKEVIVAAGCEAVEKEEILRICDVLSLHGRLATKEPPMIGAKELRMMKCESYLINTARSALVDMDTLAIALKEKWIQGAALDVFPVEPLPKDSPFLLLDNCTLTNHRGGDTMDAYSSCPKILLQQLKELLTTGKTKYMI